MRVPVSVLLATLALLTAACETHLDGSETGSIWIINRTGQALTLEQLDRGGRIIATEPLRAGGAATIGTGGDQCAGWTADIVARGEDGREIARLGSPPCSRDIWTLEAHGAELRRHPSHQD